MNVPVNTPTLRIMLLGATGTVGRATRQALVQRGHQVTCFVRQKNGLSDQLPQDHGTELRVGDITSLNSLREDGFRGEAFDAVVSCLASRTGAPDDAWAIDYQAHVNALTCAKEVRRSTFRIALGHLRSKTVAAVSICETRVRETSH